MSDLARVQRDFMAALRDDAEDAALAVYRRNVGAGWRDALAATYPVVRRLVGDGFFHEMAGRYAAAHPSRSGDLHLFGDALPAFIADYPFAQGLAYLPDVARLEWACHEALYAADAPALDALALARVPPERQGAIRLRLHPSVRLVASRHPMVALWEANQPERDGTPDRAAGAERARIWRDATGVRVRRTDAADWEFLRAIADAAALEDAVAAMGPCAEERLDGLMRALAADGVIAGFALPEGPA